VHDRLQCGAPSRQRPLLAAAGYRAARDNHLLCGRYRLSRRKQLVEEYFDSVSGDEDWSPRYKHCPTQLIPVIRQHPKEPVPRTLADPLGTHSVMGKRCVRPSGVVTSRSATCNPTTTRAAPFSYFGFSGTVHSGPGESFFPGLRCIYRPLLCPFWKEAMKL